MSVARSRWLTDIRTIWSLIRPRRPASDLSGRLNEFYAPQAQAYDDFRDRLLPGRAQLVAELGALAGDVWVDLGGGTARTLSYLGKDLTRLSAAHVVDLSTPLLRIAESRIAAAGWTNVHLHRADTSAVPLPTACADVVVLSYALTMMPEWFAAVDEAARLLKPAGRIGVVDFHVSAKHGAPFTQHSTATRWLTRLWFSHSDVFPSPDHLPYLVHRFDVVSIVEARARLPYLPGVTVPYYRFIGERRHTVSDVARD